MYTDDSFYGEVFCDYYDEQNNPVNPITPLGFFLYTVVGKCFDDMSEVIDNWYKDSSILSCSDKMVNIWGRYLCVKNPYINNTRYLTQEEYRVYIYLQKCRLLTVEDLQICFNNCMGLDDYKVRIVKEAVNVLTVVDHPNYRGNPDNTVSDLQANDEDVGFDKITDYANDDEYNTLQNRQGHKYQQIVIVEVPSQNWSDDFIELLEGFISVKGNVKVREYSI